ncbi:hypothetical protein ERJ75_001646300 [Trypanosoma vivax]|uniref:Uncharacterized protein n=1 Tax=Trypanosoma vivax (strain Y486) TaxID=1055687 RepID=G0U998_TRYVY|nr:hypothetical protein TRVL_06411 [Trypanosoma vivax]KAH8605007.1 hypothetical protein ERJ75_001646300 [Trypanosoma vivax]CCC54183.1 hypothetical protein TVY486_1116670 [Trypanosoma vivax Y486]
MESSVHSTSTSCSIEQEDDTSLTEKVLVMESHSVSEPFVSVSNFGAAEHVLCVDGKVPYILPAVVPTASNQNARANDTSSMECMLERLAEKMAKDATEKMLLLDFDIAPPRT